MIASGRTRLVALALAGAVAAAACGTPYDAGCVTDRDCAGNRVCKDAVCRFPEEANDPSDLDLLASAVLAALKSGNTGAFDLTGLSDTDWVLMFDLGGEQETRRAAAERRAANRTAFFRVFNTDDFAGARLLRSEAGDYKPLPAGAGGSREPVDRLVGSRLVYFDDRGAVRRVRLDTVLRVRGRWKLFALDPIEVR